MRRAIFQVMFLGLLRDRGSFALSFILPGLVFVVFAVIFAGTTGGAIDVRLAIADQRQSDASVRLVAALLGQDGMRRIGGTSLTAAKVRALVRRGTADVGLVIRKDGRPLEALGAGGEAPLRIVTDPAREIAVMVLQGALQKAYATALPDASLREIAKVLQDRFVAFSPEQKARLESGLQAMRDQPDRGGDAGVDLQVRSDRVDVAGNPETETGVSYYAGAVAILFLLFTAANGAVTLLDEKESGLLDRVAIGPGGTRVVLEGKFLFLVAQGFLQVLVIYLVAWLGFGVDLPGHLGPWAVTTLLAAAASAGLGLLFVTLCATKQQAQTLSTIIILIVSAIGGSMVPRFLMPQWIQDLGWLTPNTWVLEAYGAIFWLGEDIDALVLPWSALAGAGLVGLLGAHLMAMKRY